MTQNQAPSLRDVTLAILAGGEGSRMGKAKALLEVADQPILVYLLHQFAWPGPTLLVTSPGHIKPPGSERFDREVADPVAGEGPLRGALTAIEACETPLIFVTTVDMPGITSEQAKWMIERLPRESHGMMCRQKGRIEPFPLLLQTAMAAPIRQQIQAGERSVQSLAGSLQILDSDWPVEVWTNLNRADEFTAWAATVSASPPARR